MRFIYPFVLILFLPPFFSLANGDINKCHKSTEGTDFWFGFMENRWYTNNNYVEITVTAREATTFSVSVGPDAVFIGDYSVTDNGSRQVRIPWEPDQIEAKGSEVVQDRGIHLTSEKPVNVYALNYDRNSADVAVIYPVESLGTEYYAMCYTPHVNLFNDGTAEGRNSEFLIVATQDTTVVSITPSVVTDQNRPAGETFTDTLHAGQVYQVQSANQANLQGQGDLTGSKVIADKPVAFYSGNLATTVPYTEQMCCYDHLYEQIPPVHSWGREYYIVPLKTRNQDSYRIMAAEDNTLVNINGLPDFTLNKGEMHEFTLGSNSPSRVRANKSILVAQYSHSIQSDNRNGDPFMIILSPTSQSKNDVTFIAYRTQPIDNFYVNIITLTSEIANIELDGSAMAGSFRPFSGSQYSYAQIEIPSGVRRIRSTNPDRGFLAYVYGFGNYESYGYGVGFNLDLILDIGQSIDLEGDTLQLCYGDSITLDAGPYFDTYEWNTNDSTQWLTVNTGGDYWAHTTTYDGCDLYDSIYINLNHPEVEIGIDESQGCYPYSVELIAEDGFENYLWQDQDDDTLAKTQTIIADKTGEYRLTVFDTYNCTARDTMKLTVFDVPDIEITGDTLVCGKKNITLKALLKNASPTLWDYKGSVDWSANKPGQVIFSKSDSIQTDITVTDWGRYKFFFRVVTTDGCEATSQYVVSFYDNPTSEFTFVDDSPEEKCKGYSREVLYTGTATEAGTFYWDFEGSQIVESLDWQNFRVSLGANTIPSISLFVEENGCRSDTTRRLIGANPAFSMNTQKSRGCDSITVQFSGTLAVPDALLFEWNFGDGSEISNKQNPTHYYSDTGFYDVGLTVTNLLTECKIAFTIDDMVKVFPTPVAEFSADPDRCYPDSLDVIYLNNIDSSFCFWNFDNARLIGGANDSIVVRIDSATASISLQVDEFGCLSDTVTKSVKRKPHFDFYTMDETGCQPYLAEVFSSTSDDSLEFTWKHDTLPDVTANNDTYLFTGPGMYDVELIAYSHETGCADSLLKPGWIEVYPKPVADFEVNYPVATIENPDITFINLSESGVDYYWDFGDTYTSRVKNPQHSYSEIGEYTVYLMAESEHGCLDTTDFLIQIVPFSVFTPNAFRPDSDIPENRVFMPVGLGADPDRFNIKIFTRWGTLVFESTHPENKWDGKTLNGKNAPMGNYIWISDYYDIQGIEHKQSGYVVLIR